MSDPRLRPRRRAASDWLPPTAVIVRPIRLRSTASTCSRRLSDPSARAPARSTARLLPAGAGGVASGVLAILALLPEYAVVLRLLQL